MSLITLYKHQEEGKSRLLKHKRYCLFFEVGTGKTFTALSALQELPSGRVLITAPRRVLDRIWIEEKYYDLSKHEVDYISYGKIARDRTITRKTYDYIILDEVHKIKGKSTNTSRRIRSLSRKATHVWGLTGTPVANSYLDVYRIFKNMGIREFENEDENDFIYKYYYYRLMEVSFGVKIPLLLGARDDRVSELLDRIGKHSMIKRAIDCIDLPGMVVDTIKVKGMLTKKYREIEQGMLVTDKYSKTMLRLEVDNKLRQAAQGYFYDDFGDTYKFIKNKKYDALKEDLEDILESTDRVIIVYYFKEDLEQLKKLPYKWTLDDREFDDSQILFMQFSGGEGLNLQKQAHHVILYTYGYSYLNYEQMIGRVNRHGQENKVIVKVYINEGTIDEKCWWAIKNKKSTDEYLKEVLHE